MTDTYYTSLSGMLAASYGLRNTSNNIANMQSSGYKRTDLLYSSLGSAAGGNGLGSGVYVGGQCINFSAGANNRSSSASDMAIAGKGFFIVKMKNGEYLYTRNGQFGFNDEGLLCDKHSGGLVQGYDQYGNLTPIKQSGSKINPGKATQNIYLKGDFVIEELPKTDNSTDTPTPDTPTPKPNDPTPDDPAKNTGELTSKYKKNTFTVTVFDANGKKREIKLEFEVPPDNTAPDASRRWKLVSAQYTDTGDTIYFEDQMIEFDDNSNGAARKDHNTIKLLLQGKQPITLHFGEIDDDATSSVRLNQKTTRPDAKTVEEFKQDGYGNGKQIDFTFDYNGQISYFYNNGQSEAGIHVALAQFDNLEKTLIPAHDNLFRARNTDGMSIGRANKNEFGSIQPQNLEASNVDSTTEFANIIVLQRMFQACSQIMDIDKQLVEELYKK